MSFGRLSLTTTRAAMPTKEHNDMNDSKYRDPLAIVSETYTLPEGYDSWAIKSVGFDGRTKHGFLWPSPGEETECFELLNHGSSCPRREGDGLCVATTWAGMASGGYRAFCLLLVAYRSAEARGDEAGKLRVPQVSVVDRLDGEALVRADLQGADLQGADLQGAHLQGAHLQGAALQGAYLQGAYLQRAHLQRAALQGAYLRGADLRGADLQVAHLQGADLQGADREDLKARGALV